MVVEMSDGARLNVEVLGRGAGKPLMIVHHGAPGLADHRDSEGAFGFAQDQFQVLVFDARGCGESDEQAPLTHARWVADVDDLRRWAGAETIIMAGHSYGGFIALQYALAQPSRTAALVVSNSSAQGQPMVAAIMERLVAGAISPYAREQILRLALGKVLDAADMVGALQALSALYGASPEIAPPTAEDPAPLLRWKTHNAAFADRIQNYDVLSLLGEISAPTLILAGRQDEIAPPHLSQALQAGIPHAQLEIFPRSGHTPATDEPAAFQATLRTFLSPIALSAGDPHRN